MKTLLLLFFLTACMALPFYAENSGQKTAAAYGVESDVNNNSLTDASITVALRSPTHKAVTGAVWAQ